MKKFICALLILHCSSVYPVRTILNIIGLACIIQGSSLNIPLIGSDRELKIKKVLFGFSCLFASQIIRLMKKPKKHKEDFESFYYLK